MIVPLIIPVGTTVRIHRPPYGTYGLLAANLAGFVLFSLWGVEVEELLGGWWPRLLLAHFFHRSPLLLLVNGYLLYLFGPAVEQRMGRWQLLGFYMGAGIAGNLLNLALYPAIFTPSQLGASTFIFALIGAFLVLYPFYDVRVFYFFMLFIVYIRAGQFKVASFFFGLLYLLLYCWLGLFLGDVAYVMRTLGLLVGGAVAAGLFGLSAFVGDEEGLGLDAKESYKKLRERTLEEAVIKMEEEAEGTPESLQALCGHLEHLILNKNWEMLLRVFPRLIMQHPLLCLSAGPQFDLAKGLCERGYDELALRAFDLLIENYPDTPVSTSALFLAGSLYAQQEGKQAKAQKYLKKFLESDPLPYERQQAEHMIRTLDEQLERAAAHTEKPPPRWEVLENHRGDKPVEEGDELLKEKHEVSEEKDEALEKEEEVIKVEEAGLIEAEEAEVPEGVEELIKEESETSISPKKASYSLILTQGERINLTVVRRVVAEYLMLDATDAEKKIVLGKGILFRGLAREEAKRLREMLEERGQVVSMVMETPATEFPEPLEIERMDFGREQLTLFHEGERKSVSSERVRLISCGNVTYHPGGKVFQNVLDFFILEPRGHWRVWENTFDFRASVPGLDKMGEKSFYHLLVKFTRGCNKAILSPAMKKMLKHRQTSALEFSSLMEFDNYNQWLILSYFGESVK